MHRQRVIVWCRFWYGGIIGAFFFENEQGAAVTVNGECYRAMINEFLFIKIEEDEKLTFMGLKPKQSKMY